MVTNFLRTYVNITIVNDGVKEMRTEQFEVVLSLPVPDSSVAITRDTATVTILDDDGGWVY